MAPSPPRLRILSVGGNAVSAFLSWRLQATNACDVTLVWKANYQTVAQYGVSFKSQLYGNERFKPRFVVQSPEDAASQQAAFDYVLLCVKALPDVYNLADIIQSVVTPQHTCILVNTTNTLGVEKQLEDRFPTNVVLSLVSGADLTQLGSSEFEHSGSTEIWVGPASKNSAIPESIQRDMSEALAMTLTTAQVDCKVSSNIKQQQFERMIGPIAFHPASVLFETPVLADLIRLPGVQELISDVIAELIAIAGGQDCTFPSDFKDTTIQSMLRSSSQDPSTMYQDFTARRPMEVETYLGSPLELAKAAGLKAPRLATLYAMLRHVNAVNKDRPLASSAPAGMPQSPSTMQPPPRTMSLANPPPPRQTNGFSNGAPRPMRGPPMGHPMGPPGRRGPPPVNGFRGPPNSYPPRGPSQMQRRPSYDETNLDEFSHVVLYDELPDGDVAANLPENGGVPPAALRERELMLREKELQLRQQEMAMRNRGGSVGGRRPPPNRHQDFDDDDDDDDYFDPMQSRGPPMPPIDPDNFDMMSVTSRRTKRATSQNQLRKDAFGNGGGMRPGSYGRPNLNRHRTSAQLLSDMPMLGENILNNPMMGFSSNRYGSVDRKEMADESRANSLTASRLQELGGINGGPYPGPPSRRTSRSPGNPFGPAGRVPNRPSPPNDPYMQSGPRPNGRPSPPGGMPAPVPRYPPSQANMMPTHQMEQAGVSKPFPPPKPPVKSLTGSASASAGSGDSGSANIDSEPSAHSSTSSFAPRQMLSMR
ncbi:2-dehydropantoate 2-reductase [Cladophialophora carrionii]|uniref:2-dehydropantoate 2-reductase n=1 Tax=Cladophialophora carrionii TaxID=86049 RepID=A0A1C1CPU0_9EURO|nr:2-dehydropantoate 2-reductase [Cladophialophora carrionii]